MVYFKNLTREEQQTANNFLTCLANKLIEEKENPEQEQLYDKFVALFIELCDSRKDLKKI